MTKKKTIEQIREEAEKAERQKQFYENEIRIARTQIKCLTRKERTHRLCIHGGMLEKFIERPDILSEEQIMQILAFAFHKNDVQDVLRQMIEEAEKRKQGETL
jgi:hypothetical protein